MGTPILIIMKSKPSYPKLPETLSAVLRNSEIFSKGKLKKYTKKISRSASSKSSLCKPISNPSKEAQQVITYQGEEIEKLRKEKARLETYVMDLEAHVKDLAPLAAILREKDKSISKMKKMIKGVKKRKVHTKETSSKASVSHRNTPKIVSETLRFDLGPSTCRHQSSKTTASMPLSTRNSQSSLFPITLHDILVKAENTLRMWQQYYLTNCKNRN